MVRIVITGILGRMGKSILEVAMKDPQCEVVGVTETKGHPAIGEHVRPMAGSIEKPFIITDSLESIVSGCDVVIDFTAPTATLDHCRIASQNGVAVVIGTTGLDEEQMRQISDNKGMKAVISPNMSVGMNIMFDLVGRVTGIIGAEYDIEILEMHHNQKKDAPSGSALKLLDAAEKAQPSIAWKEIFGRKGITGQRSKKEIGVHALRGGDVVGEHTVFFAGAGERLEITHRAYSRGNFARGAVIAAKWIVNQTPGIYSMKEVLGLNK